MLLRGYQISTDSCKFCSGVGEAVAVAVGGIDVGVSEGRGVKLRGVLVTVPVLLGVGVCVMVNVFEGVKVLVSVGLCNGVLVRVGLV